MRYLISVLILIGNPLTVSKYFSLLIRLEISFFRSLPPLTRHFWPTFQLWRLACQIQVLLLLIHYGKHWPIMPSYADTKFKKSVVKCCCCGSCYGTNKWIWAIQIVFKQILFTFNHLTMTKICFSYTKT